MTLWDGDTLGWGHGWGKHGDSRGWGQGGHCGGGRGAHGHRDREPIGMGGAHRDKCHLGPGQW